MVDVPRGNQSMATGSLGCGAESTRYPIVEQSQTLGWNLGAQLQCPGRGTRKRQQSLTQTKAKDLGPPSKEKIVLLSEQGCRSIGVLVKGALPLGNARASPSLKERCSSQCNTNKRSITWVGAASSGW